MFNKTVPNAPRFSRLTTGLTAALTAPLTAMFACNPTEPGGQPDPDSTEDSEQDTEECVWTEAVAGEKDAGSGPRASRAITGSVEWIVDFDAAAEAVGYYDCSYSRDYNAMVEHTDLAYLCPDCTLLTQGLAEMSADDDACYTQISTTDGTRVEHLGLVESDDGTVTLYRGGRENLTLAEAGDWADGATVWTDSSTLDDGAAFDLSAAAALQVSASDAMVDDPAGARTEPYACGWPLFSPGGVPQSYTAAVGDTLPNARLTDQCGEGVDLWDFRGRFVVIDASSPNCGPCQEMASKAEDFKAEMEDLCIDVELVTLLNASLSEVNLPADPALVAEWVSAFGLTSPVLADRGFAYAVLAPATHPDGGISMPTIAVLDPDGKVIYLDTGFGETSGYFDTIRDAIVAENEARTSL